MNLESFSAHETCFISQRGAYSCYSASSPGQTLQTLSPVCHHVPVCPAHSSSSSGTGLDVADRPWEQANGAMWMLGWSSLVGKKEEVHDSLHLSCGMKMVKAESKYHLVFVWSCQNLPILVPNCSSPQLFCSSFFHLSQALLRLYCCSSLHLCKDSEAGSALPWAKEKWCLDS